MVKEAKVDYDEENDILYVYSGEKVKDSLEIDRFVLDFSADNKVVGVEIFDAIRVISKLSGFKIEKKSLSIVHNARLQFYQSKELFFVSVFLTIETKDRKHEISINLPAPSAVMIGT